MVAEKENPVRNDFRRLVARAVTLSDQAGDCSLLLDLGQGRQQPAENAELESLPQWASLLEELCHCYGSSNRQQGPPSHDFATSFAQGEPLPFREVLGPVVRWAGTQFLVRCGSTATVLSKNALDLLQGGLLYELCMQAGPTLYLEFSSWCRAQQSAVDRVFALAKPGGSSKLYREFVEGLLGGTMVDLFHEYAVLARCLAILVDQWLESTCELVLRLNQDLSEITKVFFGGRNPGPVLAIEPGLSDRHHNGRTVLALAFASGERLIYKPKNLAVEDAYFRLLDWLNQNRVPSTFKVLRLLNRRTHGWVEFVAHLPCQDECQLQVYYQRAGALLCLCWALEGTDCHLENLIACGEYPVLVDLEALMQHRPKRDEELDNGSAQAQAYQCLANSVLSTGLLPTWGVDKEAKRAYDSSGLGAGDGQENAAEVVKWEFLNTDDITYTVGPGQFLAGENEPVLQGRRVRLPAYRGELVLGFDRMYRYLLNQREILLSPESPLRLFVDCPVRFIFRRTLIYGKLLHRLRDPKHLRDGVDWSLQIQLLHHVVTRTRKGPRFLPLIEAERWALERLDIPFFALSCTSDMLYLHNGQQVMGYFDGPSYDRVRRRLQSMSEEDLRVQEDLILAAIDCREAVGSHSSVGGVGIYQQDLQEFAQFNSAQLCGHAAALGTEIIDRSITGRDGSVTWIAPQELVEPERYQLRPVDLDMYNGHGGIAVFLAALERLNPGGRFGLGALGALRTVQDILAKPASGASLAVTIGIGGAGGLGSVVYAFVKVARLLDQPRLLRDALCAARLITDERVAADRQFDIIGGGAGAILGLLALYEATANTEVLDRAQACARHLLAHRVTATTGHRVWQTIGQCPLTGFSHGAAGIAYALLRLFRATGEAILNDAADEAIAYETSVFCPSVGNWPDYRKDADLGSEPIYMCSWCHGAGGIVLARVAGNKLLGRGEDRADVAAGIETVCRQAIQDLDQYCCGNAGRVETLFTVGRLLGRADLVEQAERGMALVLDRAAKGGGLQLFRELRRGTYNPSLFCGSAGIGYQLLRLARPDLLPCLLLWE